MHRLKISIGIAFKSGELGNGPLSSCKNFVGSIHVIRIAFIGNKPSLGRGFLRGFSIN
jgi:hypothetical protein